MPGSFWRRLPAAALRASVNSRSPGFGLAAVQRLERGQRHEDLAAHLEQRGRLLALQLLRDLRDRAQVLGDVLAGDAVAARRADREAPVLVLQRDREPVELRFGDEADGSGTSFSMRVPHAASSSCENALSSDSIGTRCVTGANVDAGRPPGRCVGESGVTSDGYFASSSRSSRTSASNSASATSGSSKTK